MLITINGVFSCVVFCLLSHLACGIDSTQNGKAVKNVTTENNATIALLAESSTHKSIAESPKNVPVILNKESEHEGVKLPDASTVSPDPDPPATITSTSEIPPSSKSSTTVSTKPTTSISPSSKEPVTTQSPSPSSNKTTTIITPTASPSIPQQNRRFDGPSFIGGIILTTGLMAISFVAFKFYKARTERNYHTL